MMPVKIFLSLVLRPTYFQKNKAGYLFGRMKVHPVKFALIFFSMSSFSGQLFSQVLNVAQAGVIEGGSGVTPNLTLATSVFVSGNYAYVVGAGDALEILDVTLPGFPLHKGSLANGAGGASILRSQAVFVVGKYAYITSYGGNALEIVDVSNPSAPVHKGSLYDGKGVAPFLNQAWGLYVSGNYAYVASNGNNALEIIDISNPASPVHKGSLVDGGGSAPFLVEPVSVYVNGKYAYIGTYGSLEIVDVSNPALPVHVGSLRNGSGGNALLSVYSVEVAGNFAYITNSKGELDIIDVSNPATPFLEGSLTNGGGNAPYLYAPFSVSVSGNYAYITNIGSTVISNAPTGVFEIVDISNPSAPAHKGALTNILLTQSRSVFLVDNVAYTTSRSNNCLNIIDISNPTSPGFINSPTSGSGGALLNGARSVYVSGNFAYVASTNSNALEILDITNPSLPIHKGSLTDGSGGAYLGSPVAVFVSGNYAYVASNASGVLEIVDVSNPAVPVHKGYVNVIAYGYPNSVYVSGNYAYVVAGYPSYYVNPPSNGALMVIDISNAASPFIAGSLANGTGAALLNNPRSVYVSGNNAYVASFGSNALEIVDVSNPTLPAHKSSLVNGSGGALLNQPYSVFVSGNYAYVVSDGSNALEIIDITTPSSPVHAGSLADGGGNAPFLNDPSSIYVSGNYAYVASIGSTALEVIDVSNPVSPIHQGSIAHGTSGALLDGPSSVFISGGYGYIANNGLYQDLDVFYLYGPSVTGFAPTTGSVGTSITVTGQNFNTFVTASINGVQAPVTAVAATTITITVPPNAAIGKIVLSYSGQKVTSATNFITTPSATSATNIGSTGFTASWSDVGATGYFLDLSNDNFNTFVNGYNNFLVGNQNTLTLSGLEPATTYQYRVRSTDGLVTSITSNTVTVQTLPSTPTAKAATLINQTSFTANWTSSPRATGYYLDVGYDINFNRFLVGYNNLSIPGVSDTTQSISGLDPYTSYYYRVRAYDSAGTSPSSTIISVFTPDNEAPKIVPSSANLATITFGNSPTFNVNITDNVQVDTARIYYKGIARKSFTGLDLHNPDAYGNYSVNVQSSWLDSLGLEYYFWAVDEEGNKIASPITYASVTYPSIILPPLPAGVSQNNYRILAFPYVLSSENLSALYVAAPWNDDTKAAIWWWDPTLSGSGQYSKLGSSSTASSIVAGNGYWVLVRNSVAPQLTNVTAPNYNKSNLYSMTLKPKWNEIGNPYPVPISWNDVRAFNPKSNFSALTVFNGTGYETADVLPPFEGGFVKNNGSTDITIQIPFPGQTSIGGRVAAISSDVSSDSWNIFLHVNQDGNSNRLGGFGMDPSATSGADRYDNFNPPRFMDVPELNFVNSDFPGTNFSNDMVKSQEDYTWQFTPVGNLGKLAQLNWSSGILGSPSKQLFLLDEELVKVIDMTSVSSYDFVLTSASHFRIFYGSNIADKVTSSSVLASAPYPNPLANDGRSTINLALPDSSSEYSVNLQLFNGQGELIGSINKSLSSGIHPLEFSITGNSLAAGIYIYKLSVASDLSSSVYTGKIVKP